MTGECVHDSAWTFDNHIWGPLRPGGPESLLLGVAAGDSHSLEELYHRTRTAVYGLVLSYLKHPQDAEDVTQDAFVRIWDTAASYRPQGKPMAWLLTVARNLALMRLRERGKTQELTDEEWSALPARAPDVTTEDRHVLRAALSVLSEQERQVVMLHAVTGLKHREIAQLLELPLATVLSKYRRALKKLNLLLEGDDA